MQKKSFSRGGQRDTTRSKPGASKDVRQSNIVSARAVSDTIRTSLGPRGMDKMIISDTGEVTTTNDGATIVKLLNVVHPTSRMFVELSKAQDIQAGDGTTSVVVIAGSLLNSVQKLMSRGIHPTIISDSFGLAADKACEILREMSTKVKLTEKESLIKAAKISLASKVVSQHSDLLAPMAVDAVMRVISGPDATNVDLNDIKVVQKLGGTVDSSCLVNGLVFPYGASKKTGGPTLKKNAKIALIQFCLSAPKTDMDHNIIVNDYTQIDKILAEERAYIIDMCKTIKKTGCNVLLIQKSILRDAVSELSLHILSKMKIMVVRNIDRKDVPFICKTLNISPIASVNSFRKEKLAVAESCKELGTEGGPIIKIEGIKNKGKTVTAFLRSSNELLLAEAERSFHDALCVVRSIVKERHIIAGGGAPEIELSLKLQAHAKTLSGLESLCVRSYGEAFEIIPTTLAENAGMNPVSIVTELRNKHLKGNKNDGINVETGGIEDMVKLSVVQPLLVNLSAINLATETVKVILKVDGILV